MINTTINHFYVETDSINPALSINLTIESNYLAESPISIAGTIRIDNKIIAYISELRFYTDGFSQLVVLADSQRIDHNNANRTNKVQTNLTALLSPIAIDWIEKSREKDREKSVHLNFEFVVNYIEMTAKPDNWFGDRSSFLRIRKSKCSNQLEISQSNWINRFYNHLGIGKFLIVELPNYSIVATNNLWENLMSSLFKNLNNMENAIKSHNWQEVMTYSRKFFEDMKIGDNKPGSKKYKEDLDNKLKQLHHSDEGIKNLHDAIRQLFEFSSKFLHTKNKKGDPQVEPIAQKEDAYLVYTLSIALYNQLIRIIK